jgi:hypothetical protein
VCLVGWFLFIRHSDSRRARTHPSILRRNHRRTKNSVSGFTKEKTSGTSNTRQHNKQTGPAKGEKYSSLLRFLSV